MKAAFVLFAVLAVIVCNVNAVIEVVCSEDQDNGVIEYHPHPCDCHTYYVCLGTDPVPMPCPSGLHWNSRTNKCDWPNIAKCRKDPRC